MRCFLPSGCEAEEEMEGLLRGFDEDWYGGGDDILKRNQMYSSWAQVGALGDCSRRADAPGEGSNDPRGWVVGLLKGPATMLRRMKKNGKVDRR
jgi:hypothetical protein